MHLTRYGFTGLLATLTLLSACGAHSPDAGGGGAYADEGSGAPRSPEDPASGSSNPEPRAGQLTAGDWDDNLNFTFFQRYVAQPPGLPAHPSADRVMLTVVDDQGRPLSNAHVAISGSAGTRFEAPTGTDGRLVFLPAQDGAHEGERFSVTVTPLEEQRGGPFTAEVQGQDWKLALPDAQAVAPSQLDVAFVVDATGSMGDELSYLKAEMQGLVDSVRESHPQVSARFALVVYRDEGDDYVVRSFDFTSDVAAFRKSLSAQSAGGGGDTPEAMEQGLGAIHQLRWRQGNTARLTFLVADAPTHTENHSRFLTEVRRARLSGIRLYPVAASGVADAAEYQLRLAAQVTLGRYIFLTNDSGIGNTHAEPHIPCYQVQLFAKVLVRAIGSELRGQRLPAPASDVVRTVGRPDAEGACTQGDGTVTHLGSRASLAVGGGAR